jgi:hypothetical protein
MEKEGSISYISKWNRRERRRRRTQEEHKRIWGKMKKYVVFGLLAGVTISVLAMYLRKKKLAGTEFYGFFDSSTVADELFGDAFEELPDKP